LPQKYMPLQQGGLDGLCGVYATVNALKAVLANSGVELDCKLCSTKFACISKKGTG